MKQFQFAYKRNRPSSTAKTAEFKLGADFQYHKPAKNKNEISMLPSSKKNEIYMKQFQITQG